MSTRERDVTPTALPGIAAPRLYRILQILGAVTGATGIAQVRMGHAYRIRGLSLAAGTITTSGSVTLNVNGVPVLTAEPFVADDCVYVPLSRPVDVEPNQLVELDVASNGLNDAQVDLDIIP